MTHVPKPPKFSLALIGPGIVLIAMGLGSGEFILWPYLVSQFGFGIIWGAVIGITLQYFVSTEATRYTLATGGSIYQGFYNIGKWIPYWFILSTFISFAWPGIIASSGAIFSYVTGINPSVMTVFLLLLIGLILTIGGDVYSSLENFQKLIILVSIPLFFLIALALFNFEIAVDAGIVQGLFGAGKDYFLLPQGISIVAFLGAVAYSGAGGNLVLSNSFYVQDEGMGMAGHFDSKISRKASHKGAPSGSIFIKNNENIKRFKQWFKLSNKEQFLTFWLIGVGSILLLTFIAFVLTYPFDGKEGLDFVFLQAEKLSKLFSPAVGILFLLLGGIFLFKTQLGVYETTSRIMTENIQLASTKLKEKYFRRTIYYFFLWAQIIAAIFIQVFIQEQPIEFLLIGTFFSALSMLVLSFLVYSLNTSKQLYTEIKPGIVRKFFLLVSVAFFAVFVSLSMKELFFV